MFCPNCGKVIPDDSAFCPLCGAKSGGAAAKLAAFAPRSKTKKGTILKILIGLLACAVLAVVLILVLSSTKSRLTGKWSDSYGKISVKLTFNADGTGVFEEKTEKNAITINFKWSLSRTDKLTIKITGAINREYPYRAEDLKGRETILLYREEDAKDGSDGYWYIDGGILYLNDYVLGDLELAKG